MFPNWNGWKTVKQVLAILSTSSAAVAQTNQGTQIGNSAGVVSIASGAIMTSGVALSGPSLGPAVKVQS